MSSRPYAGDAGPPGDPGAKASVLQRLADAGYPVPPFVVVPPALFHAAVAALEAGGTPIDAAAMETDRLPPEVVDGIRASLQALDAVIAAAGTHGPARGALHPAGSTLHPTGVALHSAGAPFDPTRLAVRSSMLGEDGAQLAFAGQLISVLNVPRDREAGTATPSDPLSHIRVSGDPAALDPASRAAAPVQPAPPEPSAGDQAVVAAVQACWASAFGPRAAAYRRQHGLMGHPSMAVILQPMVPASAAGVVFTADPTTGDRQRMVIAVTAGLGDRLVSGVSAGDTLYVDRASGAVDGVSSVLAGAPLADLVRWAALIEAELGGPQDIEFAVADDRIAILQSRPITGLPAAQKARGARPWTGDETILWDNANITESYAGATSPLTRSVIRRAYAGVYAQFLALVGAGKADDTVLRTLLGFYHGQVYYQLGSWYAALALLPAFEHNRGFMEQMMGVKQAAEIRPVQPGRGRVKLAAWSLRMLWLHVRSEALVHAFLAHVEAVVTAQRARDLDELTPRDLFDLYTDLDRRILGRWQAPILTDFYAMIFFGLLRRMSERWLSDSPGLSNVLLAGDDDIESLVPVRRVAALAAQVGEDPVWSARFATLSPEAIWQALQASSDAFPVRLRAGFEDYLARYGDRCMNELKLETPTPRDQPAQLVRLVQAAVRTASRSAGDFGNGSAAAPAGIANAARTAAEARVARLGLPQRILFRSVLGHARRHVRNRENMRFARTRVFGLLRRLFLSMGRRFAAAGWLDSADDVFWLTEAEVFDMVTGTAITADLRGLAALRRAEQARYAAMPPPPERFETRGLPYLGPPRDLLRAADGASGERAGSARHSAPDPLAGAHPDRPADLRGTPCGAGRVSGRVRVVRDVEEAGNLGGSGGLGGTGGLDAAADLDAAGDLDGDILVAERTDPGWIFLFPAASGLLVERGSPLSHSAIVARELGLPTIVNIPGLTRRLRSGDRVTMDGQTGEVWCLDEPAPASAASVAR